MSHMVANRLGDTERILASSPLLAGIPRSEITQLAFRVRNFNFDPNETIFAKGDAGSQIFWVAKGRVRLCVLGPGGNELLHSMIESGHSFGEITAIDGGTRGVDAIAVRRSEVFALNRRSLIPIWERYPAAALNLARAICAQVRVAGATIENLAFHGSEIRIFTRLMFLSQQYSTTDPENGSMRIDHGLSQQDLADSVGLTRVMVNRQLSAWRQLGLTEDGRGFILIFEPTAFREHVWGARVFEPNS